MVGCASLYDADPPYPARKEECRVGQPPQVAQPTELMVGCASLYDADPPYPAYRKETPYHE
jgi:hypothetical protein